MGGARTPADEVGGALGTLLALPSGPARQPPNESIAQQDMAVAVVDELLAAARRVEPTLTSAFERLAAEHGGRLEGLDFKFKGRDSLVRKVRAEVEEEHRRLLDDMHDEDDVPATQQPAAEAAGPRGAVNVVACAYAVKDALRYTVVLPAATYTTSVNALVAELATLGFAASQVKNYWGPGDNYQGINSVFVSDVALGDGGGFGGLQGAKFKFEVQLHTPASYSLKMGLGHRLYEKFRVERDPEKKLQLWEESLSIADAVPVPEGALDIPTLTSYPQPDEVKLYAELLLFRAQLAEPHVTRVVEAAAAACVGARIVGAQYRFKAPAGIRWKIIRGLRGAKRKGIAMSAARAAERMEDVLRYTVLLPYETYAAAARRFIDAVDADGATASLGVRNAWVQTKRATVMRGLLVYFRADVPLSASGELREPSTLSTASGKSDGGGGGGAAGVVVEVQLHTEASYTLKEEQADALLDALKETTDANEQRALLHRARGVWRSLPVPRDAEALTDGRLSTVVGDAADGDKPSAETIAGEGQALFAGK